MILLVDRFCKIVKMCQNDEEFCRYISHLKNQENEKIFRDYPSSAIKWGFSRYTHKCLSDFLENQDAKAFREVAEYACEQRQDILVIHKGERTKPLYISFTSDLNFTQLRKDWCLTYAQAHGLSVIME